MTALSLAIGVEFELRWKEVEREDYPLMVKVPLMPLVVVAGDGFVVVFINGAATVGVGIKVLFPSTPSHITSHELVLNDVGT